MEKKIIFSIQNKFIYYKCFRNYNILDTNVALLAGGKVLCGRQDPSSGGSIQVVSSLL